MTVVSNDPSWWPVISSNIFFSYWTVAAGVVVVYDWVLTLGQEIELIWKQRWSLMTVLYLVMHYIGIPYSVINILRNMTTISLTDAECNAIKRTINWTIVVVTAMLGVIMIARLHAMHQRSRIMLIFLVIIFLAVNITSGVIAIIGFKDSVAEELIFSGIHTCGNGLEEDAWIMMSMIWVLNIVWEVLALCLSVRIAVKHFLDLRRLGPLTGSTIGDCFRVLIKSHVLHFASFVCVSFIQFGYLSPKLTDLYSVGIQIFSGSSQILWGVQMFVMGPRLILSVREYYAELVGDSDAETSINSIVFQEYVHVPTSSTV